MGRVRLCQDIKNEPPISTLGFDPMLSTPSLQDFATKIRKRGNPVKSLLLDQTFSAGVGNWVADEILFHSRIHPEQKPNSLDEGQIKVLYEKMQYVCQTAVGVDGDASQFPEGWLFKHRWGKGKRNSSDLKLPSGEIAVIKWITVGSRTSAFVPKVQILTGTKAVKKLKILDADACFASDSSLSELDGEPLVPEPTRKTGVSTDKRSEKDSTSRKRSIPTETLSRTEDLHVPKRRRSSRLSSQT